MAEIHVLRRDPDDTDDETLGMQLGDVVINLLTGDMFYKDTLGGQWIPIPIPVPA